LLTELDYLGYWAYFSERDYGNGFDQHDASCSTLPSKSSLARGLAIAAEATVAAR
jgi:hypothetical protein